MGICFSKTKKIEKINIEYTNCTEDNNNDIRTEKASANSTATPITPNQMFVG